MLLQQQQRHQLQQLLLQVAFIHFQDSSLKTKNYKFANFITACKCGNFNLVSNPAGRDFDRIVGGFVAPPNSIPYQVGIWYKKYD